MEAKVLFVLFFVGLLAFSAASDDDSNGSDSGSESNGSYGDSFEEKDNDCDRLVEGSDDNDGKCDLTDGIEEIPDEIDCTPEDKNIILTWIASLKVSLSVKVTVEERLVIATSSILKFQMEYPQVFELIQYRNVSGFGYLASFTQVVQYRQTSKAEGLISLDDDDNCPLFDALWNCTDGSEEMEFAVNSLINETLVDICGNYSLTVKEKYVLIYKAFSEFFALNPTFQFTFFQTNIQGFGCFQLFFEITKTYYQVSQIDIIFEGTVSECSFMVSLKSQIDIILNDASVSVSMKGIFQSFYERCEQQLELGMSGKARLNIFIKLAREFIQLYGPDFASKFYKIYIANFGSCFELIGCGIYRNPKPIVTLAPPASSSPKPTCGCTCQPVTVLP